MRCLYPIRSTRTIDGRIQLLKKNSTPVTGEFHLPCGQCIHCKLERTRQWAVRITHEASLHQTNEFVTLTYNTKHEPRSLHHKDFRLFIRRLRKHYNTKLRYFMCGEYGEQKGRPHFHACIFGINITDKVLYSTSRGKQLYTSPTLEALWGKGWATTGEVNFQTASYVAAYCTKKVTGEKAIDHYERLDTETGELYQVEPEYAQMSRRPGIAHEWIKKYKDDVYNYDHVVLNGKAQKAPRYYDQIRKNETGPKTKNEIDRTEKQRLDRQKKAIETKGENDRHRLNASEKVTRARMAQRQRTL